MSADPTARTPATPGSPPPSIKLSESNGNLADAGGTLSIYAGGVVEVDGAVTTIANTTNTTNTTAGTTRTLNLVGGTLKTGSLSLASSSHLNFQSGTLWLTGGTTATGGAVTLGSTAAATLKGSGTIGGGLVTTRGTISPGDGISGAAFTLNAGLAIGTTGPDAAAGTFAVDLDYTANTADRLNVNGTVTLANAILKVDLHSADNGPLTPAKTFLIIQNDGTDAVAGTFSAEMLAGLAYTVVYNFNGVAVNGTGDGNDVALILTGGYTPEPTALAPLLAATFFARRRTRRKCTSRVASTHLPS